jgi:hypothetical protein
MNARGSYVHQLIAALARELHSSSGAQTEVVTEVVKYAGGAIPSAQYAGITLADDGQRIETLASTHEYPVILDVIQQRHREGPCLSAAWSHGTVRLVI